LNCQKHQQDIEDTWYWSNLKQGKNGLVSFHVRRGKGFWSTAAEPITCLQSLLRHSPDRFSLSEILSGDETKNRCPKTSDW